MDNHYHLIMETPEANLSRADRDAALWLGRHVGRRRLAELAALVEGCDYTTVAKAVSRFGKRLAQDAKLADGFEKIQNELSKF